MKADMAPTPSETDKTREELRICRLELGQVRVAQEQAAESLLVEERQLERVRKQLQRLAEAVDEHLSQDDEPESGLVGKISRRLPGRSDAEKDEMALLRSSEFFSGPWYLSQHPEVVASGQSAIRHYLRHGTAAGFDPSPLFSTRDYLRANPEVAESGINPLVHFLTDEPPNPGSDRASGTG